MPHLLSEFRLRDIALPNRIGVSPMCQYSSVDGFANDWHFAHLAARAVGGAGLVFTEAAAVSPEGRISPQDLGVWSEKHFEPLARIARFIDAQGAIAGIQLAHAGRKASVHRPWSGRGAVPEALGGWRPVGPSAVAFGESYATPDELSVDRARDARFATPAPALLRGSARSIGCRFPPTAIRRRSQPHAATGRPRQHHIAEEAHVYRPMRAASSEAGDINRIRTTATSTLVRSGVVRLRSSLLQPSSARCRAPPPPALVRAPPLLRSASRGRGCSPPCPA